MKKQDLTDNEELEAQCLIVSERFPCMFRQILQRLGWVVDVECPIRQRTILEVNKYFATKENEKYEKEFPDEN